MTFFQWFCAGFGLTAGFVLVGIVIFDCYLLLSGQPTISKHVADVTHDYRDHSCGDGDCRRFYPWCINRPLVFPRESVMPKNKFPPNDQQKVCHRDVGNRDDA